MSHSNHSTRTNHSPLPALRGGAGGGVSATRPDDGRRRRTRRAFARALVPTDEAIRQLHDPANAPILMHDAFNLRLAQGDPDAVALKQACDRWQTLRNSAYRAYCKQAAQPHLTRAQFHDLNDELGSLCRAGQHNTPRAAELRAILAWPGSGEKTTPSPLAGRVGEGSEEQS